MTRLASQNVIDVQKLAKVDITLEERMNLTKSALDDVQFDLILAQKDLDAVTAMVKVIVISIYIRFFF